VRGADVDRIGDNNFPPSEILKLKGGIFMRICKDLKIFTGIKKKI
jgi:hypothetical protein